MGISKKQLMDSVGLVKEYVDEGLTNARNDSNRSAESAVYGEHMLDYSFNYTVGCDMAPLLAEHGYGIPEVDVETGELMPTSIPMVTEFQFIIVTLDVSTLCTNEDGTDLTVHSMESRMIPVRFLYDNKLNLLVKSSSKACIHKIAVDIMKWDPVDNYYKAGTVTMSYILYDGSIEIVAYDVENCYSNDSAVQHTMKLDIRFSISDYDLMNIAVGEDVGMGEEGAGGEPT